MQILAFTGVNCTGGVNIACLLLSVTSMIEDSCAAAAHHAFSKMQAADDISSAAMLGSLQSVQKPCAESGIPYNRTFAKQRSQRTLRLGL